MLISDTEKFVFIHNPKCAGTSIRTCLRKYDTTDSLFSGWKMIGNEKIGMSHIPLWKLNKLFPEIVSEKLKKYFTFMIVRNPYTRFIASFNSAFEQDYITYRETFDIVTYKTVLNEFIENVDANKIRAYMYNLRHFVPQTDMIFLDGEWITDTIIKIEEFPNAFDCMRWMNPIIAHRLMNNLKNLNSRGISASYDTILTRKSMDIINEVYKRDFENFRYPVL